MLTGDNRTMLIQQANPRIKMMTSCGKMSNKQSKVPNNTPAIRGMSMAMRGESHMMTPLETLELRRLHRINLKKIK
jgi:hypothetical protein